MVAWRLGDRDGAPLAGLRIIEVSSFVAAPLGGMTLAQLGAEVIRIDPLGGAPDTTRWPLAPNGGSLYWAGLNKGKRSVTLDLRSPGGQRAVADLVASSGPDGGIVLTNAGYPWLSYEALKDARPDLIHLRITGRHDGSPAVDYTVNAGIGFPLTTGDEATAGPVNHVLPAWDVACGLYAAIGILAAERHRRRTGAGRAITLALADVALAVTGHLGFLAEGQLAAVVHPGGRSAPWGHPAPSVSRGGPTHGPYPPQGRPRIGNHLYGGFARDFRTRSGDSVMVVTLTARHYADLARVTGRTEALAAVERALGADFTQRQRPLRAPRGDRRPARPLVRRAHDRRGHRARSRAPRCCGSAIARSRSSPPTRRRSPTPWSASSTSRASAGSWPQAPRWPSQARRRLQYQPRSSARTRKPSSANFAKTDNDIDSCRVHGRCGTPGAATIHHL